MLSGPSNGHNLIENGFGELGSSENFVGLGFDAGDFPIGHGSFVGNGNYQYVTSQELIPLDPYASYTIDFYGKCGISDNDYNYAYLDCYDVDGKQISTACAMFVAGTTTSLTQDLNNGDMEIHVASLDGWVNPGSFWHRRGVRIWNYSNALGYTYPAETYSRNYYKGEYGVGLWDEGVGLDYTNNVIRLRQPWSGGALTSGTKLSQNDNGGTFLYYWSGTLGTDWTRRSGIVDKSRILPGTAFVKLGWILNYRSTPGNVIRLAGVRLRAVDTGLFSSEDGNVGVGRSDPDYKLDVLGTIRANEVIVEAPTADYVFEEDYRLRTLAEVEAHIAEHGHLPGIPSAREVAEKGVAVGDAQRLLLEKVEELTLYVIEKDKRILELEKSNGVLVERINRLEEAILIQIKSDE